MIDKNLFIEEMAVSSFVNKENAVIKSILVVITRPGHRRGKMGWKNIRSL